MSKQGNKSENNKNNGKLLIALCVVIVVLLAVVIVLLVSKGETSVKTVSDVEEKRNVVVNAENAEEIAAEMAEEDYVEPGYYTVNMATEWHFAAGDSVSDNARVDNVAGNTNPVYFDVFLAEDESEPIYSSPVIPVGSFLENIAMDNPLGAGTYDCVMVYHLVDDDQNTISTLRVTMKITVDA